MVKAPVLVTLLFINIAAYSQQPDLYFRKINTANGLSHNKVNCILQDKRGFIWIGTDDGLNRYDGNNFLIFRNKPGSAECISGNIITGLLEDENEVLWIATADGGLTRYDYHLSSKLQFKQYKNRPDDKGSIPVNIINALLEDKNGMLWLATSGKRVIRFNKKTEKFDELVTAGTSTALALSLDAEQNLWVGRQGGGLLKVHTQTLKTESDERYQNLYAKLPHVVVTSLFTDKDNNVWYGSWDKVVYRYNFTSKLEEIYQQTNSPGSFANDEVNDFTEDNNGHIWMAGNSGGLHVLDKKAGLFYNYRFNAAQEGTIADNTVNCVFTDRNNNLWAGTNKGVSVSRLQQQFVQQFLPGAGSTATIYDVYRDKNKTLWLGTSEGIFSRKHGETAFQHSPINLSGEKIAVTKFFKDADGTMYLGTNYSLFRYNATARNIELLPNTSKDGVMSRIIESRVVSVIRDTINGNPVLLVSPYGHFLAYYDLKEKKWVSRLDTVMSIVSRYGITDNLIHKFYRSADGGIWLANAKDGLGLWEKNPLPRLKYFKNNPSDPLSITNNHVFDMADDGQGNLWLTTFGGGLQHFNIEKKQFRHIASSANLLEGVQTDASGNVWMIGGGNLQHYQATTKTFSSFDLPDIEKSGGVKGYLYKDDEGNMYAAGRGYFIQFRPDSVKEETRQPGIIFTDFKIFNNSFSNLLFDKKIKLKYTQNYFTIEFAAPYFSGIEKIRYSYKLEGVDKDWVDAGNTNFASYPNTGNGNFTFRVRAAVGNGQWIENKMALEIEVVPPIWKRWWFYTLCAVLIAASAYALYRYRVNELLKRQSIRNKIAQDLHDSVGSTLSSIAVYSQVAQIENVNRNQENLVEVLEKISNTSNDMIGEMNDIVWAINPRNDSMDKIIQRMESFAKPLLAAKNIRFTLEAGEDARAMQPDMTMRKNLYLIFKESVNNAVKYSGAGQMNVAVKKENKCLVLTIKDDGKGFDVKKKMNEPAESLSGNGLPNMFARAREINGELLIESFPGKGTFIRLSCPV